MIGMAGPPGAPFWPWHALHTCDLASASSAARAGAAKNAKKAAKTTTAAFAAEHRRLNLFILFPPSPGGLSGRLGASFLVPRRGRPHFLRAEHADVSAPPMHRVLSKPTGTGIDSARLEGGIEPWRSETKAKPLIKRI